MNKEKLQSYQKFIKSELDHCLDFWLNNGMQLEDGGICTSLDESGKPYSMERGVWMQGRSAWLFSYLCNIYGVKKEWLDAAKSCIDYMEKYCFDKNHRMYLAIDEKGNPITQRRECFSEAFYIIGNAEYSVAANDKQAMERAKSTYDTVWELNNNLATDPNGNGYKVMLDDHPARAFADPMIYLNTSSIMRRCDPENTALYNKRSKKCIEDIFTYHCKPDMNCVLEAVGLDGTFYSDIPRGRIMNPGHDIECSWFLIEEANYLKDKELHKKAEKVFNCAYDKGFDKDFGGVVSFVDCMNKPCCVRHANNKVWWSHCEVLIASLMLYRDTKNEKYLNYFEQILDYCKAKFSDATYGECYSYLTQEGEVDKKSHKGGIFKGPFHLPRMLIMVDLMLTEILKQ